MFIKLGQNPNRARRNRRFLLLSCAILLVLAFTPATSSANSGTRTGDPAVISDWNQIAVTTLLGDTTKTTDAILYMGFVQAAVYDAVVGVDGRYAPYKFRARAPHPSSDEAAAVAAAYTVLVTYSPYATTALNAAYNRSLAKIPDGTAKSNGIAFGIRAAQNLIRLRQNDGRDAPIFFTRTPAPGIWRPTPPGFIPMFVPWLAFVKPLLVHSATQFRPPPAPSIRSARYTRDFNEVKAYGSLNSTVRTPAQTATALFFSGNAVFQYEAALRDQAATRKLNIVESARMFAAVDMSVADAIITVWRAKYIYGLWRPITAINLADTDGNAATVADPRWVSLVPAPPYPEYSSGYNAFTAAVTGGLSELFHTDHLNLTLTSTAVPNVTRHYATGSAVCRDVVNARIWLGIHFRSADVASRNLGLRLSDWTLDHYFQPVDTD